MSEIEEFYDNLIQEIYTSADISEDFKESQFFEKAMGYLLDEGVVEDYTYLHLKKLDEN